MQDDAVLFEMQRAIIDALKKYPDARSKRAACNLAAQFYQQLSMEDMTNDIMQRAAEQALDRMGIAVSGKKKR